MDVPVSLLQREKGEVHTPPMPSRDGGLLQGGELGSIFIKYVPLISQQISLNSSGHPLNG